MKCLLTPVFFVLVFAASAAAQIEINVDRVGIDIQIYIDTDGTFTVEDDWFGNNIFQTQLPDWLVPDGIEYEANINNGGNGYKVPGGDEFWLGVDAGSCILEAYIEHGWESLPDTFTNTIEQTVDAITDWFQ